MGGAPLSLFEPDEFDAGTTRRLASDLIGSVYSGRDNAGLIAEIAPLYLTGSVLDVTYGRGRWWSRYRPTDFTFHDVDVEIGDGVDFRELPHPDASFDAVTFDPPYLPHAGGTDDCDDFRDRFGLVPRTRAELDVLVDAGFRESARVARRWLLTKTTDYTNGRQFHLGHYRLLRLADELGIRCHDLIIHASGTGPVSVGFEQQIRARRGHSYLLVFDTRPLHRGSRPQPVGAAVDEARS